jgi:diamine N-acetyltransferase
MQLSLQRVTKENFEEITDLQLLEHQRDYLASNSYSIAQASFHPHYHPRAVYAGDVLVGFLMYVSLAEEGYPGEYGIWRLMVDHRHQGKGYGRKALELALEEIRSQPDVRKIWISYVPSNPVARQFYGSLGFVETEIDEEGEMVAVLDIEPSR